MEIDFDYEKEKAVTLMQKAAMDAMIRTVKGMSECAQVDWKQEKALLAYAAKAMSAMDCDEDCKEYEVAKALDYSGGADAYISQSLDDDDDDDDCMNEDEKAVIIDEIFTEVVEKGWRPWDKGVQVSDPEDAIVHFAADIERRFGAGEDDSLDMADQIVKAVDEYAKKMMA